MGSETHRKVDLGSAAAERMERWLLSDELRDFIQLHREPETHPRRLGPYITVSRESGAGGGQLARLIGQQLGWDVLDKSLLDCVAERYHMPRDLLEIVDEKKAHVIQELLHNFFVRRSVSSDQYVMNVEHVIYLAAIHGRVVIVGRGAHCVLPREHGLAVRFIAPRGWRVRQMMERRGIAQREAEQVVDATDSGRSELCKYYLGQDSSDPHNFDLVVNVEQLGHELAARMVADLARHRFQLPGA